MWKQIYLILILFLLPLSLSAEELKTGESVKKFTPGDKVIFKEDFSSCPVGEIPSTFDKIRGMGECVRYGNQIYFSPINHKLEFCKKVPIQKKDFSVEYDVLFLKNTCYEARITLRNPKGEEIFWFSTGPGCSGEGIYASASNIGRVYEKHEKSIKKKVHVALQVRRNQLRVFLNGKRVVLIPFNKPVGWICFTPYDKYSELISNIRIALYSSPEKIPSPEKLGIKVEKKGKNTKLLIPEKVLFDFGKFYLKPESKKALHSIAVYLKNRPDKKIKIIGYTDNVGSKSYNLKLSLQRAQSVADYLIYVEDMNPKRITKIEGKGEENPIAPNNTEEGRAKNRRVEIILY